MNKMDKFRNGLSRVAEKFQSNVYVKAINGAMMGMMPLMMISSIATLIGSINIGSTQEFFMSTGISTLLNQITGMTLDIISVYVAFLCAYKLGGALKKDKVNCGVIGLMAFLILTPMYADAAGAAKETILISSLGSGGMFVAMVAGLIGARLYIFFIDRKLTINLPEQVPPVVAKSFAAIVPGAMVAFIMGIIYLIMLNTPFNDLSTFLMYVVQTPLNALGANVISAMILVAFAELLWFFGIHGSMAIMSIMMVLFYEAQLANLAAYSNGEALPYLFTFGYIMGNRGARSFAVSLLCIFRCKSKQMQAVGKIGFVPALFGISEPIKFGIPQVMNIRMLLPLMLTPAVCVFSAWLMTIVGFLPYNNGVSMPIGSPIIISAVFTNGWQGIVAQIVQLVLCILIYIPFIKAQDKAYLADELKVANAELAGE